MKKFLCLFLSLVLTAALTAGAMAAGGPAQNYGGTNETNSAVTVVNGDVAENPESGSYELADGGQISGSSVSGIFLTGADTGSNALYLAADSDAAVFSVGGEQDNYTIEGVGSFNSVILAEAPVTDPDVENFYGVGITTAGGLLTVNNTYIHTVGCRASAIYTMSGTPSETSLVVKDSVLWSDGAENGFMPDFVLMVGSARATLFLGEDIWFYNSAVIARDWGALSHDTNTSDIQLYAVNTYAETYAGGYCLYALDGTQNYFYGSKLVSAQYGMFVMGAGEAVLDNLDAADEAAMQYAGDESFENRLTEGGDTLVAGVVNGVVFHVNGNVMDPGVLTVSHAKISTMPEDVVSDYGNEMNFDFDSYLLSPVLYGESWFYLQNCYGSAIVTRSHGGIINIEQGAQITPSNGVLLQTLVAYDSSAGNIFHDSTDTRELKDVVLNIDAPIGGDVLHEDYQRDLYINISADYAGRVVTGSITAWNNLWTAENLQTLLEQGGHAGDFDLTDEAVSNIRSCLVREEDTAAYTDVFGVNMTISSGGCWNVEGQSSVLTLTIEDGGTVNADRIYIDCAFGEDGALDPATGTEVSSLAAGTYENVVLFGAESVPEEFMQLFEFGGEMYLLASDFQKTLDDIAG